MSGINIALLHELRNAVAFLDKVRAASEDERIAVGQDHWERLEAAARALVSAYYPEEKTVDELPKALYLTAEERSLLRAALRAYGYNGMLGLWAESAGSLHRGAQVVDFADALEKKLGD